MKRIDNFPNAITMYRLVVYVLGIYAAMSVLLALLGKVSFSATSLVLSMGLLAASTYITDRVSARLAKAPVNSESWLITSLIIFFVVRPATTTTEGLVLVLAGVVSSLSKYLLTWNNKHIFNPAAFAAAVLSLTGLQATTWWIGGSSFWVVTLILGLAVVRKIRRFPMVLAFAATSVVLQFVLFVVHHQALGTGMKGALIASPLIFLSTFMLTEPATMPPRRNQRVVFAVLAAVLYVFAWRIGPLEIYPEVALLLANVYAFIVSPKWRVRLRLAHIQQVSKYVYSYRFMPERPFAFQPGQYMDWTLAGVPYDNRGNRRTFTIASSPTEKTVEVGLKYYVPASSYKATFSRLKVGDMIYASQLAGNFTVDWQAQTKLVFIAGGIGITPFRSMVQYALDKGLHRDTVLLYVVSDPSELAYNEIFQEAQRLGVRYIPVITNLKSVPPASTVQAKLSAQLISRLVPDYAQRTFYVSGPNIMVDATKEYLHDLSVPHNHIVTDHFSGY